MDIALKKVNNLPTPTWNRLGINFAEFGAEGVKFSPYTGSPLSKLPEGVTLSKLPFPQPDVATGMGPDAADFVLQNKTYGVSLRAAAGVKAAQPVFLDFRLDGKTPALADSVEIAAEENSEVTVVMSYRSDESLAGFHGGLTKLCAAKGAVIHLVQVNLLGGSCVHFDNVGAFAEEGGRIDIVQAELGGKRAVSGVKTRLDCVKSSLRMDTVYFGDHSRSIDMNYVAEHIGPRTNSEIRVVGALLDESEKTFRGTIDFVHGSKKAVGHESESNLLFSPKVRNRTAPLILCAEEDVEGQHAASTGKIGENTLFYLMSRGLSELEAKKLMIEAQFRPVTDRIPSETLRNDVADCVKGRLSGLEPMG
jgi:Fe-S cluster assembly scaffold protein SufB